MNEPIDPALYERDDLRAALAAHRFGPVFDAVNSEAGLSYREIGRRTGCHESVIDAIRKGRIVEHYAVLVRIVEGLGIRREAVGLGYGTYAEQVTVADPQEGVEEMLRRHLLAQGGIAIVGATVTGLGELLAELPGLSPVPTPSEVFPVHVAKVRDLTRRLADAGMTFGSDPELSSTAAAAATRLLDVPGAEPVKRDLMTAVAQLHIHAGRAAFDGGLYARAMYHLAYALDVARQAGDPYPQALALNWAGVVTTEHGYPGDGLKMLQCAQVRTWSVPRDHERRAVVEACGLADSALALTALGETEAAHRSLGKSRELWHPTRTDRYGDLDIVAARLEAGRGRFDAAEPFAAASLMRWEGISERARADSRIVLAAIHVRSGDSDGLGLAHNAITAVGKLSSVRARKRLEPLGDALDTRRGSDYADLARQARHVATIRA